MSEIVLSQSQLEDSFAQLESSVATTFGQTEAAAGYYQPEKITVPRPIFSVFAAAMDGTALNATSEMLTVTPAQAAVFQNFAGLRGIAKFHVRTDSGARAIQGPAIVLANGRQVSVLAAEAPGAVITEMQHALLENEYVKQLARVKPVHKKADVTNAAEIGAALVVASSVGRENAHTSLHGLAEGIQLGKTFGSNFSAAGRQDIVVGHMTRRVRSVILSTDRVIMQVDRYNQLDAETRTLGLALTAGELAVGMTLAATTSRGQKPNLTTNLANMVGA